MSVFTEKSVFDITTPCSPLNDMAPPSHLALLLEKVLSKIVKLAHSDARIAPPLWVALLEVNVDSVMVATAPSSRPIAPPQIAVFEVHVKLLLAMVTLPVWVAYGDVVLLTDPALAASTGTCSCCAAPAQWGCGGWRSASLGATCASPRPPFWRSETRLWEAQGRKKSTFRVGRRNPSRESLRLYPFRGKQQET